MAIEAMKQALEALEKHKPKISEGSLAWITHDQAITALRTAIAEAEKQEPVAWVNLDQYGNLHESSSQTVPPWTFPVYRSPPAAPGHIKGDTRSGLVDNDFGENT